MSRMTVLTRGGTAKNLSRVIKLSSANGDRGGNALFTDHEKEYQLYRTKTPKKSVEHEKTSSTTLFQKRLFM